MFLSAHIGQWLQKTINSKPFLQAVAAVALGNDEPRAEIEEGLRTLERNGRKTSDSVKRIWTGELDSSTLTADLDSQDAALVHRILKTIQEHPHDRASLTASAGLLFTLLEYVRPF